MDEKKRIIAQARALHKLVKAMQACDDTSVPRAEILEVIRPHLLEDDDVALDGTLFELLSARAASQIIQIVYERLLSGATFTFVDGRRTRKQLLELCDGIGEVRFTRDRKRRRVWITKPPS